MDNIRNLLGRLRGTASQPKSQAETKQQKKEEETLFQPKKSEMDSKNLYGGMISINKSSEEKEPEKPKQQDSGVRSLLKRLTSSLPKADTLESISVPDEPEAPEKELIPVDYKVQKYAVPGHLYRPKPTVIPDEPKPMYAVPIKPTFEPEPTIPTHPTQPTVGPEPTMPTEPPKPQSTEFTAKDIFTILGGKDGDAKELLQNADWGSGQAGGATGRDNLFLISQNDLEEAFNSYSVDSNEGRLVRMFYDENGPTALFRSLAKVGWAWGGASNSFIDFGEIVGGLRLDRANVVSATITMDALEKKLADAIQQENPFNPERVLSLIGLNLNSIINAKYDEQGRIIAFNDFMELSDPNSGSGFSVRPMTSYTVNYHDWDNSVSIHSEMQEEKGKSACDRYFDSAGKMYELLEACYYSPDGQITSEHFMVNYGLNFSDTNYSYDENGRLISIKTVNRENEDVTNYENRNYTYDSEGRELTYKYEVTLPDGKINNSYYSESQYYDNGNLKHLHYDYISSDGSFGKSNTSYYEDGMLKGTSSVRCDADGVCISDITRNYDEKGKLVSEKAKLTLKPGEVKYVNVNGAEIRLRNNNGENSQVSYTIDANGHMELNANGMEIESVGYIPIKYTNLDYNADGNVMTADSLNEKLKAKDDAISDEKTVIYPKYYGTPLENITINGNNNKITGSEMDDKISVNGDNNVVDLGAGEDTLNIVGNNNKIKNVENVTMNPSTPVIKPGELGSVEYASKILGFEISEKNYDIKTDDMGRIVSVNPKLDGNISSSFDYYTISYNENYEATVVERMLDGRGIEIEKNSTILGSKTYDKGGQLVREVLTRHIMAPKTTIEYNQDGSKTVTKEFRSPEDGIAKEVTKYDADGNIISVAKYDKDGNEILEPESPNGPVIVDGKVIFPNGKDLYLNEGETAVINKDGNVEITKADGSVVKYTKDGNEIKTETTTLTPSQMLEVYDEITKVTKEYSEKLSNRRLAFVYNIDGNNNQTMTEDLSFCSLQNNNKMVGDYRVIDSQGNVMVPSADDIPFTTQEVPVYTLVDENKEPVIYKNKYDTTTDQSKAGQKVTIEGKTYSYVQLNGQTQTVEVPREVASDGYYYTDDGRKYIIAPEVGNTDWFQNGLRNGTLNLEQAVTISLAVSFKDRPIPSTTNWEITPWQNLSVIQDKLYTEDDAQAASEYENKMSALEVKYGKEALAQINEIADKNIDKQKLADIEAELDKALNNDTHEDDALAEAKYEDVLANLRREAIIQYIIKESM